MAYRITLTFVVDMDEASAWEIAEALETAGMKRDYREVSSYAEEVDPRTGVLVPEGSATIPETNAERLERRAVKAPAMTITTEDGSISLGGDDGTKD